MSGLGTPPMSPGLGGVPLGNHLLKKQDMLDRRLLSNVLCSVQFEL